MGEQKRNTKYVKGTGDMDSIGVMKEITDRAKKASALLRVMSTEEKNKALLAMAKGLDRARDSIKTANAIDVTGAEKKGKNSAFIDRLVLGDSRIDGMVSMLKEVAAIDDPVGEVLESNERPNGLIIEKVSVPIGVIGIIYESRPNVTADCISLCLKSGNVVILRGGSDSINSNKAIFKAMKDAALKAGLVDGAFILIEDTSRELVDAMLKASGDIDLIMPRGGESLIKEVVEKSRVPVIKHYKGICHVYVDVDADPQMAEDICFNAKVQRPGVCNAMETLLIHEKAAEKLLPRIASRLREAGVRIKGCSMTLKMIDGIDEATEEDYSTEWLELVLNIRIVRSLDEAVNHIARFGSNHSDAIVTENRETGIEFTKRVDSSAVYINASTRFTDGREFGKGAEIGISTDKLHARGPMGLKELTTYKYIVYGNGQIRQ